jgi:subtilisin family serine protease
VINAVAAYERGATGAGITIAVIDTGVDATHPDLEGQVLATSIDLFASQRTGSDADTSGHGTLVAGVIAAKRDGAGILGTAFGSSILSVRADTLGSCSGGAVDANCSYSDPALSDAIDYAIGQGVQVINLSLGGDPDNDPTLENAIQRATDAGILVVTSAGNEAVPRGGPDPDDPEQTVTTPIGRSPTEPGNSAGQARFGGRLVVVGSIDLDGVISDFSNRAGSTQNFYILAPGEGVISTGPDDDVVFPDDPTNDADDDGDYYRINGTSFAAPYVSGALALMLDLFPNITPEDALAALLESADDYVTTDRDPIAEVAAGQGTDTVSGVGILNLERAFAPQGATSFTINGRPVLTSNIVAPVGGAFGDAVETSGAFEGLVFQDKFARAYVYEAPVGLPVTAAGSPLIDLQGRAGMLLGRGTAVSIGSTSLSVHQPMIWEDRAAPYQVEPEALYELSFGIGQSTLSLGSGTGRPLLAPRLSLSRDLSGTGEANSSQGSWARFSHPVGDFEMDVFTAADGGFARSGLGVARVGEGWAVRGAVASLSQDNSALGTRLQSRFGLADGTATTAYSIEGAFELPLGFRASGWAELASVDLDGLATSEVWTSGWRAGLERKAFGGQFALIAAQPRRAEAGDFSFSAPVGIERSGELIIEERKVALTPSGRQQNYEARWTAFIGEDTRLEAAATLITEPNHIARADDESAVWVSLRSRW